MKVRLSLELNNLDEFINNIMSKYKFDKKDYMDLKRMYFTIKRVAEPMAVYKINHRVTGIREIDDGQAAIATITLGYGVDRLKGEYVNDSRVVEAYMLDCIADELLYGLYSEFNRNYTKFHRRYIKKYIFFGNELEKSVIPEVLLDLNKCDKEEKSNKYSEERLRNRRLDKNEERMAERIKKKNAKAMEKSHNNNHGVNDKKNDSECGNESCQNEVEAGTLLEGESSNTVCANEQGILSPAKSVIFYAVLTENPETAISSRAKNLWISKEF